MKLVSHLHSSRRQKAHFPFRSCVACTALVWLAASEPLSAAIIYVDATTANTKLEGGNALILNSNYTSNSGEPTNGFWHLRSGVGNGKTVWISRGDGSSSGHVSPLVTEVKFPEAGGYRMFAYIWDSRKPGEDGSIRIRLGNSGRYSRIQASELEPAESGRFTSLLSTSEMSRRLMQIPLGVVTVPSKGAVTVCVDVGGTNQLQRTWYDGLGYERVFSAVGERMFGIDFNKSSAPAAPSQAMFRVVPGSDVLNQNPTNIIKPAGSCTIKVTKGSTTPFEFRGANGDASREIPGGPTSLSFLVADFIGGRDGLIRLGISGLPIGTYLFRSYHLESFNSSKLGFAQGTSPTTPNTLRAHVAGALVGIVQPTALGVTGLGTTFISDTDIPTLEFPIVSDGVNTVFVDLSTIYANETNRFIFLNGFEVLSTTP